MSPVPSKTERKGLALLLLAAAQFVVVLDASIVNVALPSIGKDLQFSQENLSWVVNAYVLVFGGFLLLGGRVADLFGRRKVFVGGLVLFGIASLLGGLASNEGQLIAARAVQGLGAALMTPQTMAVITRIFPPDRRGAAMGLWGATAGVATLVGPVLGGVLVDGEVRYGIEVPLVASILAGLDPDTEIQGLDAIPPDERPADRLVNTVHLAFQVMVGLGTALLGLALWGGFSWWRHRRLPEDRVFLACTAVSGVAAVVALEAGWVVTEVGRQPWTVVGLLRTADAAPTTGNLWPFFGATVVLYAAIAFGTFYVLRLLRERWRAAGEDGETRPGGEADVPYGPSEARTADRP